MKITGTKKLFIILFALLCALAAGLGVVISRSGAPSRVTAAVADAVGSADSVKDEATSEDEPIQPDEAVEENSGEDEQLVEKEYDERFDEGAIRDIADIFEADYDIVNLYCHVKNIDPQDILDILMKDKLKSENKPQKSNIVEYDREKDGVLTQEMYEEMQPDIPEDSVSDGIYEDMATFVQEYSVGNITVSAEDEQEDWFVSPDEMSSYAFYWVWHFIGYKERSLAGQFFFYKENLNATGTADQWTEITYDVINDDNLYIPVTGNYTQIADPSVARQQYGRYVLRKSDAIGYYGYDEYSSQTLSSGDFNFNITERAGLLAGFHAKITLEAGQRFLMKYISRTGDSYNSAHWDGVVFSWTYAGSQNAFSHIESQAWYGGEMTCLGWTSLLTVDGDAPTGSLFYLSRGAVQSERGLRRVTWAPGCDTRTYTGSNATFNNQCAQCWTYWIEVVRKDAPKPELAEHDVGDVTKYTANYEGEAVPLTIYPDYGASLLKWTAWTNSSCTLPDTSVVLISRSQHGVESTVTNGFKAANLVVGSSVEGMHYVKLESPTGRWSDGTTTPVVFKLEVKRQTTRRPTMMRESGVLTNGTEKDVNFNGEFQTVTFLNADPDYVTYTAPGMYEESWEGTTLTLKQKEKGKYTIVLYLKNPDGCSWADADGGGTRQVDFIFWIQEQLIDQPDIESYSPDATRNGKTITADYNGEAKTLTLSPAREEQLIIVAAGMTYEFIKEDRVPDADNEPDYFAVVFSMVDAGTQTISIFPNEGYLWQNKTDTTLIFKITINATPIDFPQLAGNQYHKDKLGNPGTVDAYKTKVTYAFNPAKDWYATIVIKGIPKSAIIYTTSMTEVSWLPEGVTEDGDYPDYQRTVLTLRASNANQYIVTFGLSTTNYVWKKAGDSVPQFILQIDKCQLQSPKIIDEGCDTTNHELDETHFKIEGITKTVYWNTEENLDQALSHEDDRFFDLFVGGFTGGYAGLGINAGQITIRITKQSVETNDLAQNWLDDKGSLDNSTANVRLWANKAGNYIIEVTPTANYEWANGTNDMITFKFVVAAVFHDTPDLFYQPEGSSSWALEGFGGETEYSGDVKNIRIGNDNDATKYYIESEMSWSLIRPENGQVWNSFDSDYPSGFRLAVQNLGKDENDMDITVLQGWASVAGTYIIRLSLKDENSVWRDGTGGDMDYTFTIRRKSIGTPVIIEEECSGGDNLKAYVNQDFIAVGYDGFDVTMAINVLYDENIIRVNVDPVGNDDDPEMPGGKGIWIASWGADSLDRLYVRSRNVGTHIVQLYVYNPNYRWDNGETSYEFSMVIHPAEVEDVAFYYGTGDDMVYIGQDNADYEKAFDPDVTHYITVTRSDDAFQNTNFESQFTFKVSYIQTAFEYVDSTYNRSNLEIGFYDANTYYIEIFLTSNYRWKTSEGLFGDSRRMEFTITPKIVGIPKILDEGERENGSPIASIDNGDARKKEIVYDAAVSRSLLIDLGNDFRAYKINEIQTSSYFNRDGNVSMTYDKKVRYTGKSAGSYFLALELTDSNNYAWYEASVVVYELKILPRSIAVPDAYFAVQDDVGSDANAAHVDVLNGVIGNRIAANSDGDYKAGKVYDGKLQYIYLFGYAIENSEVTVTVTPANPGNAAGIGQRNITASSVMKGHYVYAKLVNVYTVKVEFKLSDEFGTPNCFWSSEPMGINTEPRIFLLEIGKLGVELPNIQGESLVFDNSVMEYHTTYTGDKADKAITIEKALSSAPILFMSYAYDKALTDILWHAGNTLDFSILGVAMVGTDYKLTISLDTENEYWVNPDDSTDVSDINEKIIAIVIDKLGITAPKIFDDGDGATYSYNGDDNAKMLKFNGSSWNNSLKLKDVNYDRLTFSTVTPNMTTPYRDSSDHLVTGSTIADSGTYELIISLRDKRNLKWDGTADDSENLIFKLVIDPKRIDKPVLDIAACDYNKVDDYDDTGATDLTVTYYKDTNNLSKMQYIVIKNFVDDEDQMIYEFLGDNFEDPVGKVAPLNVSLKFGSANVGEYKVKITPSKNVGWNDGTEDPVIFTLKIQKKIYDTPEIDDLGDPDTVSGQTRTVTYELGVYKELVIHGIDKNLLTLYGTESSSEATINKELIQVSIVPGAGGDTYTFKALNVGVYKVTFFLINYTNEGLDYAPTADHITFTLKIVKQNLEVPVFDLDADLLLNDETVNANTFTAVYDAERHGALILNVLDEQYVNYAPVDADYDKVTGTKADKFFYGDPVASTTPSDTVGSVFNVGGYITKLAGAFANGTTTLGDSIERNNYILVHAVEPGTYEIVFSITDTINMQWINGSINSVTLRIVIKKKQIPAPQYMTGGAQTKTYTGNPVTFEIANVYGISNAEQYVNSAEVVVAKGFDYELFQVDNVVSDKGTATIVASKYNVDTHVLTVSATEIGDYTVTIRIIKPEFTEWTNNSIISKTFVFHITKRGLSPEIDFVNPLLDDGTPDSATQNDFDNNIDVWPKSTTVSAQITFPNVNKNAAGYIVMDNSFVFEVYYVNTLRPAEKLCDTFVMPSNAKDLFSNSAPIVAMTKTSTDAPEWSLVARNTPDGLAYDLVYTFTLTADSNSDYEIIPMGSYVLYATQYGNSTTYTMSDADNDFKVVADRAPFETEGIFDFIVWEVYKVSDESLVGSYSLSDIFPGDSTKHWADMTQDNAVKLNFLENNDSYSFVFTLDPSKMNSCSTVREALQSWNVDWDGNYGGKNIAKYAGPGNVSVKITAKDSNEYSFADTTYTFYYYINRMLYDLDGLEWDYDEVANPTNNPFTFSAKAHTVKLVGTFPEGLSVESYEVTGYDRNSQIYVGTYKTSVKFTTTNPNYERPEFGDSSTYISTKFNWEIEWEIKKQLITPGWTDKVEAGATATASVPRLDAHDEKVNYTYYKKQADNSWKEVDEFINTVYSYYKVYVELKSDDNPALDYASNYVLVAQGCNVPTEPNVHYFEMDAGIPIVITVEINGVTQASGEFATLPNSNIHDYVDETVYEADIKLSSPSWLSEDDLIVKYYSTTNTLKPIDPPTEPGHYVIKITLNAPEDSDFADGAEYVLTDTVFYFDVVKGKFDPDDVYWRYEHVDLDMNEIVAKYDEDNKIWGIISFIDKYGNDLTASKLGQQPNFVYDGQPHNVFLYSEDGNLVITTRNMAQIHAGKFTDADGTAAVASFVYNGKHWENPMEGSDPVTSLTVMEWEIKKAVIDLTGLEWEEYDDFVYTISGGDEKKFSVSIKEDTIPDLLKPYVVYKSYNPADTDSYGNPKELAGNTFTKVGRYLTEFIYKSFFEDSDIERDYELGELASGFETKVEWEIKVREITVPETNNKWEVFDGIEHELMNSIDMPANWQEYIKVAVQYAAVGSSSFAAYDGTDGFGNETSAIHAGRYKYILSIISGINTATQTNVKFKYTSGSTEITTTNNQEVVLEVKKATMIVKDWSDEAEYSTVTLDGTFVSYDFIDYKFRRKSDNSPVTASEVAASSGEQFIITVYVKSEYANDVTLTPDTGKSLEKEITSIAVSNAPADQTPVRRVPYIEGYIDGDLYESFNYDDWKKMMLADADFFTKLHPQANKDNIDWFEYLGTEDGTGMTDADKIRVAEYKAQVRVSATYTGNPITFVVSEWDTDYKYSKYLILWQGSLTHNEAGDYSVIYMLKKDTSSPYCWDIDANNDGVLDVDRSVLELKFRVAFNMIPYPMILDTNYPTYRGSEVDILKHVMGDAAYDEWITQYGKYFNIIGATATSAGSYTLQLVIKDIYFSTVHWDNNTAKGQPGTITIKWKILPIYIALPDFEAGKKITYDGTGHSIFELFVGYSENGMSEELQLLMQLTQTGGTSAIDAGSYVATFKLPDNNYAWKTSMGTVDESLSKSYPWAIQKKVLDMSKIKWNYDEKDPFQYTVEYGELQDHTLKLEGIPEELNEFMTYYTDGVEGNTRALMGKYHTVIYFFQNNIKYSNYSLENAPAEFREKYKDPAGIAYAAIDWEIVERRFNVPLDKEILFDGTVKDLLALFGIGEGWENYLDVTVKYKPLYAGDDEYVSYFDMVENDALLGYSPYKVFYLGDYYVEITVKSELNAETDCVVWVNGSIKDTGKKCATLTIKPLEITIEGWEQDDDGNWIIKSETYDKIIAENEDCKDIFEYVIRDAATGDVVDMDHVKANAGVTFSVEFRIKDGNDYAVNSGIEIGCADGVTNPHIFCNENFPGNGGKEQTDVLLWLPIPKLVEVVGSDDYDGTDKVYHIANWNEYYLVDTTFAQNMLDNYGVNIFSAVSYLVSIGKNASCVNPENGEVTIKGAGDFEILLRLLPNVNISWYDSDQYEYTSGTLRVKGSSTPITGNALKALVDREVKSLTITVNKMPVEAITDEMLAKFAAMIPDLEYTGRTYDLHKVDGAKDIFDILTAKYGDLIEFKGYTGTEVNEYTLIIKLKDEKSSYWVSKETETVQVNVPTFDGYDSSYEVRWVETDGKWDVKYVNAAGEDYNGGDYKLTVAYKMYKVIDSYVNVDTVFDDDGNLIDTTSKFAKDENGNIIRYSNINGAYVEDPQGVLVAKYKLRADGSITEMPEQVNGRNVVDKEKSVVTVTRIKTSTAPYEIKWYITNSTLAAPTLNESIKLIYNGKEQSATKVLNGFVSAYMEIVSGGYGTNVDTYEAKIRITNNNYAWRAGTDVVEEDGVEYVIVKWNIEQATVDLANVRWKFTDGTNDYANGEGMVYTRKNNVPVIYWAELDNLPEALKGSIKYKTNGRPGANAGTDVGLYRTTFEIDDPNGNFKDIIIPDTLETTVSWHIQRRLLEVPAMESAQMIFDDKPHDLLEMLNLEEDWAEYFTITVMYAKNFISYDAYAGHNGNPYEAFGAGAYRFVFAIKTGINTNLSNPCVAWLRKTATTAPTLPEIKDEEEKQEELVPQTIAAVEEVVPVMLDMQETAIVATEEPTVETVAVVEAPVATVEVPDKAVKTVVQQVCDRIKELTYGAQIQLHSHRKFTV